MTTPDLFFIKISKSSFSETLVLKNVYYVLKKYWPYDRFFCFSESGVIASSPGWLKV